MTLYDYCVAFDRLELLQQWCSEENGELMPEQVTYGSHQKVWWRCEKGHPWQAAVYTRVAGTGCPVCAGKKLLAKENSLAAREPALVAQWHSTKNGALTPEDVMPGVHRKVWWQCGRGHEWRASIHSRTSGSGCPICAGKVIVPGENDLASQSPELARQWNYEKNAPLTPEQITAGNRKKVWWRCEQGHQWQASVSARSSNGSGCPICSGKIVIPGQNDLESQFPKLTAQWDQEKNGALRPCQVSPYSNRRVWWRCELGHSWRAIIAGRTSTDTGCPYCTGRMVLAGFNDLETKFPKIAAQWHPTLNGSLTPQQVSPGSHKKIWWQCADGHVWQAVVYSRTGTKKHGCPVCAGKVKESEQFRYADLAAEKLHIKK